jgi:hypothetical protein
MLRGFGPVALVFLVANVWLGSMLGTTGSTLGSFTASTTNTGTFTSDAPVPAPLVTSITPADSATRVPILSLISVAFSESMDPALTQKAVRLQQVSGPSGTGGPCSPSSPCVVPGTYSWPMPSVLVFQPTAQLMAPFVSYQVVVTRGAVASKGNGSIALATQVTSGFTTGDGTEKLPLPKVVSSAPSGVAQPKTAIQLTFSQQMDVASAQAAFQLLQTSGTVGSSACSSTAPCPVAVVAKGFSWGGPTGTIMSYVPNPDLTGANYRVVEQTTAKNLYGLKLDPGTPVTNQFDFAIAGGPLGPPNPPVITSPTGSVWVSSSTFTISGTTSQPNLLIQAFDEDGHLAASLQLDGGAMSFSLPVPVAEGANKFTIVASNAFYHSLNNPTVSLTRDDRATTLDAWSVVPDFDQIEVKLPYHGDIDNRAYATFTCVSAAGPACAGSPTGHVAGANGQFAQAFTGLTVATNYAVQADVFDVDPVTCLAPWTVVAPNHCSQSMTLTTTPQAPNGGAILSLTVTPNDGTGRNGLVAPAALQKQAFKLSYNCGLTCTTASSVLLAIDDSSNHRVSTGCTRSSANGSHQGSATVLWDGKDNSGGLVGDGSYAYTLKVFDDGACGATVGSHFAASQSGAVKVSNVRTVGVTSPATSVTAGTTVQLNAKLQNGAGGNVADGDTSVDPTTGAGVLLTAVGAVSNAGISFTGGSVVNGIPQVTTYVGEAGQGCAAAGGLGQACAQLAISAAADVAQYITVTATTKSGASSVVTGQFALASPPLPPSNIVLTPGSINVSWTASPTRNVAGYRILLGTAPGQYTRTIDAGNVTSYHIVDVDPNTVYYVTVQSYTADGLGSPIQGTGGAPESSIALGTVTPVVTGTVTTTVTPTLTATVTGTPGPCGAATVDPAATAAAGATCTPTATATATTTATGTATAAAGTSTVTPTATGTTSGTATPATATPSATAAPPTATATAAAPTATGTPAPTSTPTPTNTAVPSSTPTRTATPANTNTPTPTRTP